MSINLKNKNYQSLGVRAELISEAGFGRNRVSILKYTNVNSAKAEVYVAEIYKDANTRLLVAEGAIAYSRGEGEGIKLEQYSNQQQAGVVSGFIRGQVTGESLVMTDVIGAGSVKLNPSSSQLEVKQYLNSKIYIPNTNAEYLEAIIGDFDIANPQKIKSATNTFIYSEISLKNSIVIFESGEIYEVNITPESAITVSSSEIAFWTGNLLLDASAGDMFKFSGSGQIYLVLSHRE